MSINPHVQRKAQAELDAVVGKDRLPTFADRASLPYMSALVKEVLRWHVPSPIGVAHRSAADDVYEGRFIPAGTLVVPNVWCAAIRVLACRAVPLTCRDSQGDGA